MAAVNPAQLFLAELTCAVCQDYFKDPVSLDCGHHFCQACITQCWEALSTNFPCPECKETFSQRNFKPDGKLRNIVEASRKLTLESAKEPEVGTVCEKHQRALDVFCQVEQTPNRKVCHLSGDHKEHTVLPIEEAAEDYKDIKGTLSRCEREKFQNPVAFSSDLKGRICDPSQRNASVETIMKKFKVLPLDSLSSSQQLDKANVTLDLNTAHPELIVSKDWRSVRYGGVWQALPNNPERFDTMCCVLGCEGFTSGSHYWEVEVKVEGKGFCFVGVTRESVSRKGQICPKPEHGIWAVQVWEDQYQAPTSPTQVIPLSPSQAPRRIRVYLDYEGGRVQLFDAGSGDLIVTFPPASFAGDRIRPFFRVSTIVPHWQGRASVRLL